MKRVTIAAFAVLPLVPASMGCKKPLDDEVKAEILARESYGKKVLFDNDAGRAYGVSSTSEIIFEQGFSDISYDPPHDFHNHAFRWMGQNAHVRLKTRPGRAMKLHVQGWIDEKVIRTKPFITFTIDGDSVATTGPIEEGHYWLDTIVPAERLQREWVDLNIRTNSVAFHWSDPPVLMVVLVYNFAWTEAP